jgi:phage baseplate assembly protein W
MLMSRETGKDVSDLEHLKQSIMDILLTPIGTRVWLRQYGSVLLYLLDRNLTPLVVSQIYGGIAEAIARWEPRFQPIRMTIDASRISQGVVVIDLEGLYLPDAKPITMSGIELVYGTDRKDWS